MKVQEWEVKRARFSLKDEQVYILQGIFPSGRSIEVFLDKEKISAEMENWEYNGALEMSGNTEISKGEKVTVFLTLPENWEKHHHLCVFARAGEERLLWYESSVKRLKEARQRPAIYLEEELADNKKGTLYLRGWAADTELLKIGLFDQKKKKLPCKLRRNARLDIQAVYFETEIEKNCGFTIEAEGISGRVAYLVVVGAQGKNVYPVNLAPAMILKQKMEKYVKCGMDYWKLHGMQALTARVAKEFLPASEEAAVDYPAWIQRHIPGPGELERQRNTVLPAMPKFSLILPVKDMGERQLKQLLRNLENQTYRNFEICLADETEDLRLHEVLHTFEKEEERLHVTEQPEHTGIAEGVQAELLRAKGEYLIFLRQEDLPTPDALFALAQAVNEHPEGVLFYPDNDRMTPDGNHFFEPELKPDFDPELLESTNYMGRFFMVKRSFFEKEGKVDAYFSGACDYDLLLRLTEAAEAEKIVHIPRILCHIRISEGALTEAEEEWEKGRLALQAHYERLGEKALVQKGEHPGLFRTRFVRKESPLISILILSCGKKEALKRCIASIDRKSSYQNYEYLILTEEETLETGLTEKKLQLIHCEEGENTAACRNRAVQSAGGEYLLFLDVDTELIAPDSLEEMLGCCMREKTGIVGARLYDGEKRIVHAGVIIGLHRIAGDAFSGFPKTEEDVYSRILCRQGYSAVTGKCMLVKKSIFEAVGGFSEEFGRAFADLDFCLRAGKNGKRVVYEPYAEFYHYGDRQEKRREAEEKLEEFHQAIALFEKRWSELIRKGDPFYNPNLTLEKEDFSLKRN